MNISKGPSELEKILYISDELCRLGLTPKEFMAGFLTKDHPQLVYRRRSWGTKHGSTSSIGLVRSIKNIFLKTREGSDQWADFIQGEVQSDVFVWILLNNMLTRDASFPSQAIRILRAESPPTGYYPSGSFQSAVTVSPGFFSDPAMDARKDRLTTHDTPFLYNILVGTLARPEAEILTREEMNADDRQDPHTNLANPQGNDVVESDRSSILTSNEAEEMEYEGDVYSTASSAVQDRQIRSAHTAAVICSMMVFNRNRRQNGLQLANSIRFLACGVSETVNEYLHYMGLTSSRKTALVAMQSLARAAANKIVNSMAIMHRLAPALCIDNLDMEERVHLATVGTQNRMFHGTWGYIHVPSKALWDTLDPSELTLEAYHNSLRPLSTFIIEPGMFLPTSSNDDYELVWKSQLARVMGKYVATASSPIDRLPYDPPEIEQISCEPPEIHMLRLMDESDNSAEGIGQVMEALQRQSGLEPEEFFARLQLIDGDLGTAQIFNAIRSLRSPSEFCDHHLNNVTFTLGASHTLWNISQAILTKHYGEANKMDNLGVWRFLDGLGIPPEKVIQKKDFTKMIHAMEHVHESTLQHCLRVVMNIEDQRIEEKLPVLPTARWNAIIDECYDRFCSPDARRAASARQCPKLANLLIRLQDFSTVVEANRAMKAGDVGRLINIWKMWSIMTQSLPGLTHYSAYLPRLVLMLTRFLPQALAKLIRHNLLVSPSGRPNHFVAKDFLLENHNYWLKYFYNRAGIGTQIDRLKKLFSSNIPLLRTMFRSLRKDSGGKHVQQSHMLMLKIRALEKLNQMACDNDILDEARKVGEKNEPRVIDTYLDGLQCLKKEVRGKKFELGRFLLHIPLYDDQENIEMSDAEEDLIIDGIIGDSIIQDSPPSESEASASEYNDDD
ncbi:hypothetical protein PGT21_003359 [Puccinia graminis f. sp. tritici]|uniref:DUF6589 domain-containing protein n=2 Tax=Puccinia graminis f. sp. tritici TaxID=56615 RepID=A0A5B0NRP0_PUCGR|nr:hypothetical protein PGT21_003359 [Puccinia graminis f. sp. tritici]